MNLAPSLARTAVAAAISSGCLTRPAGAAADGEDVVNLVGGRVCGGVKWEDTAAVDEDVDVSAAPFRGAGGQLADALFVGQIGGNEIGVPPEGPAAEKRS
ncbi:MAG TPA: hypothetical protein VG435_08640 [Acidimicrobiales bacterium]|jgi:hypothetical protein|nr:hypothetical protein [Acidimicrobiales bacterium]